MNRLLLLKISFYLGAISILASCSYLTPKSANEFTVTRKSPLVIPPDMNMIPPSKKNNNKQISKKNNSQGNENFNLENILTGEVKVIKKVKTKNNKKNNYDRRKIVKAILKMKESMVLK